MTRHHSSVVERSSRSRDAQIMMSLRTMDVYWCAIRSLSITGAFYDLGVFF